MQLLGSVDYHDSVQSRQLGQFAAGRNARLYLTNL